MPFKENELLKLRKETNRNPRKDRREADIKNGRNTLNGVNGATKGWDNPTRDESAT